MLNYDIRQDLSDQHETFLKYLLGISVSAGVVLFAMDSIGLSSTPFLPPWVTLLGTILLSEMLRRRRLIALGVWVYLIGLLVTFGFSLWKFGPSTTIYFLLFIPVFLAILLSDRQGVVRITLLSIGLMIVITAAQTGILAAPGKVIVPVLSFITLAAVVYIYAENISETVYWAVDIQQKDARRAELIYEQKEQLSEALRQLTHAHSRLELLNVKLAESQRRTEQASQAKSVFLSNMSHELRTPLNVIIGYTSGMLDMPEIYDNVALAPAHRRDIQLVKDSGYYLLGLINDILDLSKIEAGKLELHCASVNLPREFRGIVATSIGLVKDKSLQIRPDFPDDLPLVWADPTRVRQIILNLMSNAIKFTQTGSVTLHAHVERDHAYIAVIDTGIGIPENALAQIFDRFEQAERDTDKRFGGTGLGLDISKQLVQMHGSDLTVQSTVGQGSTFSFTLPLADEAQRNQSDGLDDSDVSIKSFKPATSLMYTILLVEDETSMRDMMRRTLENADYAVVDVQDGAEVLEMVSGLLPDLIILDICLPNINGWELLTSLKQSTETAHIPVMVCTVDEDEERARQLGAELYSRKPFSADEFLACIQELLPNALETNQGHTS